MVAVLEELTSLYPAPAFIRSENGPEFIAQALRDWCEASATTRTAYLEPGSPWRKGFAESLNGRFRDEYLNTELLTTAPEAQLLDDRWRWVYNTFRPHSALQGRTPLETAKKGVAAWPHQPTLISTGPTKGVTSPWRSHKYLSAEQPDGTTYLARHTAKVESSQHRQDQPAFRTPKGVPSLKVRECS